MLGLQACHETTTRLPKKIEALLDQFKPRVRLTASGGDGTNVQVHTVCHTLCLDRHRAHVVQCRGVWTVDSIILASPDIIFRYGIPLERYNGNVTEPKVPTSSFGNGMRNKSHWVHGLCRMSSDSLQSRCWHSHPA